MNAQKQPVARMESMEARRMMSVAPAMHALPAVQRSVAPAAATAVVGPTATLSKKGILRIYGTQDNDGILVSLSKNKKRVAVSTFDPTLRQWERQYTPLRKFSTAAVKKLKINVLAGQNEVDVSTKISRRCTILGGAGEDTLRGGNGHDVIRGGNGHNRLEGNGGNDKLYGGDYIDGLFGEAGNDTLIGGGYSDVLMGGAGNDLINTRDGHANDWTNGGAGRDRIVGDSDPDDGDLETNGPAPVDFEVVNLTPGVD